MQIFSALQILQMLIVSIGATATVSDYGGHLLKEDGFHLLKEDGGRIII